MGLIEKRHWQAALAAMVLCGVAMPVMAETDTPVVVSTAGTTVSGDINVAGTTSSGGSTLYALRVSDAASGGAVTLQNKVTADFTSQWSKDDAETYSAVSGISVAPGYTGNLNISDGSEVSLTANGANVSGITLLVSNGTEDTKIQLGKNVNLSYVYTDNINAANYLNASALSNRGGSIAAGEELTVSAESTASSENNLVGGFSYNGGNFAAGKKANIQATASASVSDQIVIVHGVKSGKAADTVRSHFSLGDDSQISATLNGQANSDSSGNLSAASLWNTDFTLGEGIQTTATVNGGVYLINGLQFVDSSGTIGRGLVNTVTLTNSASGTNDSANMVTGLNMTQSGDISLGDGNRNTVNITGNVTDAVLGTQVSSGAALHLGSNSYTEVTVHGDVSGQGTRTGKIAGLSVQGAGSALEGKSGTEVKVTQDTGKVDEVIGLDAQNGGKMTLGDSAKVAINHNSVRLDGDSYNLYSYGIHNNASSVSLGNEGTIIANGYTSAGIYTNEEGAVTTLGDSASVNARADHDLPAYGVWADNSGTNILGKESTITSSATGKSNSAALFAANGGANQVGNGAQIKAETETGFAYGVETDQGTNKLGENINIYSHSSKFSAYGMSTSGTQGITTVSDGLVIQTLADRGQARGIFNGQEGTTTIGNQASITVTGSAGSGYGIDISGGKVKMGDNAIIQVKGSGGGTGISIGQETGSSVVETGKNTSITVESDDMSAGILNDGGTMTASDNFSAHVSGVIDSYGVATADGGNTTIGSCASISVESKEQDETGSIAVYTVGGNTVIGDNSTITAAVTAGTASGVNTTEGNTTLGNQVSIKASGETAYGVNSTNGRTTLGNHASVYASGNTAYGVASQESTTEGTDDLGKTIQVSVSGVNQIGAEAQIKAISTNGNAYGVYSDNNLANNIGKNQIGAGAQIQAASITGDAYGVYAAHSGANQIDAGAKIQATSTSGNAYGVYADSLVRNQWNQIGENATISVSAESGTATGIYAASGESRNNIGNGVKITANGNQGIGVYAGSAVVNFLGAARISGENYSLYSSDTDALINLSATGTKIISGDMYSEASGTIDVLMDTEDSLFTGASIIAPTGGVDGVTDIAMSNGARWNMTGDSSVTNLTVNSGAVVNMTANTDYQTLTVDNFNGNNGIFLMKSDLETQAADQSDKVAITAAEAGSSGKIQVSDASFARGTEVTGTRHQLLVTDASENAVFTGEKLDTGGLWDVTPTIENGLNVYDETGNVIGMKDEWYLTKLTKKVNDDTRPLLYGGDSTYAMYRRSIDTLRQRRGNLRQRGKTDDDSGIWVRSRGGQMEGDGWDSRYNIFQLGYEYSDTAGSVYGFFGECGIASPDYETGNGKEHTLAGGIYGTWYGDHGRYTDIVAKIGRDDTTINTYGPYPDKGDYRTAEQSLSVEHGRTLYRGKDRSYFIEPQVQLVLGHLNDTSYTTERGTRVERDSLNSAIGRLGIVLGKTKDNGEHPYDYYLKASVLHEFGGRQDIHLRAANGEILDTRYDYGETWVEVGLGGTYRFNTNTMAYMDIERSYSSKLTEKWQINAGISWQF